MSLTIATITPLKIESDSRTFKQASSLARFGYDSVVIEKGITDIQQQNINFSLLSITEKEQKYLSIKANNFSNQEVNQSSVRQLIHLPRLIIIKKILIFILHLIAFCKFFYNYIIDNLLIPLKYLPKASIYYLHSPIQFPAIYLLTQLYKVPYIYDAHDFYPELRRQSDNNFDKYWVAQFMDWIEGLCVKRAVKVITVSDGIAQLYKEHFQCEPLIIRNCHDFRLDTIPNQDIKAMLKLSEEDFLIVNVGNAKSGQAIENIIEAMSLLPEQIHLACVGKNYEKYISKIDNLSLLNRIHLVSPVKPTEVVPFIKTADLSLVLYFPQSENYQYSLPNKFFQSISAELPVLYPDLPEMTKIANQYNIGIQINPENAQSIRDAILLLYYNPVQITQYKNNLSTTKMEISWENEETRLYDLLKLIESNNVNKI